MKAKFGILSIGVFCATVVLCVFVILRIPYINDLDNGFFLLLYGIFGSCFLSVVGMILGIMSMLKKEEPKCFRYIGFGLNLLCLLFVLLMCFG
jgi:uncharacterized Tic20 family protein